jgi:hypothetical protein
MWRILFTSSDIACPKTRNRNLKKFGQLNCVTRERSKTEADLAIAQIVRGTIRLLLIMSLFRNELRESYKVINFFSVTTAGESDQYRVHQGRRIVVGEEYSPMMSG